MSTPPITVLMTVYNNGKYLHQAIQSILAQTFGDFEFLIIDDASQDNFVEIIKSFDDQRIHLLVQEKNCGQTASLNKGLQLAKGRYIARIDADDVASPERLEKQYEFVGASGPDFGVVGTRFTFIDAKGDPIFTPRLAGGASDILWHLLFTSPVAHPSVLMDKEAVLKAGGYDGSFRYVQDQILWTRLLKKKFRIYNLEGPPLMQVRLHPDSATQKGKEGREQEAILAMQEVMASLFHLNIGKEEARNFYRFLMGLSLSDNRAKDIAIQWMKKCCNALLEKGDGGLPWGRTLLRLSLFGNDLGFLRRLQFFFWAFKDSGVDILRGNGNCFDGFRYFKLLRRMGL